MSVERELESVPGSMLQNIVRSGLEGVVNHFVQLNTYMRYYAVD